jgi:hypothetical protein
LVSPFLDIYTSLYRIYNVITETKSKIVFENKKEPAATQMAQQPKRPASSVAACQQACFAPAKQLLQKRPYTIE